MSDDQLIALCRLKATGADSHDVNMLCNALSTYLDREEKGDPEGLADRPDNMSYCRQALSVWLEGGRTIREARSEAALRRVAARKAVDKSTEKDMTK